MRKRINKVITCKNSNHFKGKAGEQFLPQMMVFLSEFISMFAFIPSFMGSECWKSAHSQTSQTTLVELVEGPEMVAGVVLNCIIRI